MGTGTLSTAAPARPGSGVRLGCRLSVRWQCELKRAACPGIARRPYAAVMLLDNRPADRQSHAHAARLRCEEGVEQPADIDRRKRRAEIAPQRYAMSSDLPAHQHDDFVNDVIYVEPHWFESALLG